MPIKRLSYKMKKAQIKEQILKDRLKIVFSKNPKKIAKILEYILKRKKNV